MQTFPKQRKEKNQYFPQLYIRQAFLIFERLKRVLFSKQGKCSQPLMQELIQRSHKTSQKHMSELLAISGFISKHFPREYTSIFHSLIFDSVLTHKQVVHIISVRIFVS